MCDLKQLDFPEDFQTYYLLKKSISGTRRTIVVTWNHWNSKYVNSSFGNYSGRLSEQLPIYHWKVHCVGKKLSNRTFWNQKNMYHIVFYLLYHPIIMLMSYMRYTNICL